MPASAAHPVDVAPVRSAHDRLKDSFNSYIWASILLSAAAHFVFLSTASFNALPDLSIRSAPAMQQVELEERFELPPPPEQIARPAIPVLSTDVAISEDVTIAEVTFAENPVTMLPPPPTPESVDISEQPVFTPYEVKPELKNRSEFGKLLEKHYPPILRDAGIGGTVVLWVFIDEAGSVKNTRVTQSSGYEEFDLVAQQLMREAAHFSPAYNRDQKVPVWIQLPVTFQTRGV